jgi:hypothetical protein
MDIIEKGLSKWQNPKTISGQHPKIFSAHAGTKPNNHYDTNTFTTTLNTFL